MAARIGARGGESITVKGLGNGTVTARTVPGDGKVTADQPEKRNERSAANFSKPQEERFGR